MEQDDRDSARMEIESVIFNYKCAYGEIPNDGVVNDLVLMEIIKYLADWVDRLNIKISFLEKEE